MSRTRPQLLCLRGGTFVENCRNAYSSFFGSSIYEIFRSRKRPRKSSAVFELYQSPDSEHSKESADVLLPQRPKDDADDEEPLDPHSFEYNMTVWALRLPAHHVSAAQRHFKDRVFRRPKLKPVIVDKDDPSMRILLLNPHVDPQVLPRSQASVPPRSASPRCHRKGSLPSVRPLTSAIYSPSAAAAAGFRRRRRRRAAARARGLRGGALGAVCCG